MIVVSLPFLTRQTPSLSPKYINEKAPQRVHVFISSLPHRNERILNIVRNQIKLAQVLPKHGRRPIRLGAVLVGIVVAVAVGRFVNCRVDAFGYGEGVEGV